jgi:arylsulfatase A-like enzyme
MKVQRHTVFLTLILSFLALSSCNKTVEVTRPNILFIMSDDHAKKAVSSYNKTLIETPNIDRLAREGIRFDNAFVTNAICAPSRSGIHIMIL